MLYVYGEKRTGKSTLINTLIGAQVLPNSDGAACTVIRTIVDYGEKPCLHVYKTNFERPDYEEYFSVENAKIILTKHLSGKVEDRDEQAQNFVARVFWPSEFLKQGITVVDTPGLNETDGIDSMVRNGLDSFATTAIFIQVVSLKDQFGANVSFFSQPIFARLYRKFRKKSFKIPSSYVHVLMKSAKKMTENKPYLF